MVVAKACEVEVVPDSLLVSVRKGSFVPAGELMPWPGEHLAAGGTCAPVIRIVEISPVRAPRWGSTASGGTLCVRGPGLYRLAEDKGAGPMAGFERGSGLMAG